MSSVLQETTVSGQRAPAPSLPPPPAYLFPENMGPKITWGQNHGGQRAEHSLTGAPGGRPPGHWPGHHPAQLSTSSGSPSTLPGAAAAPRRPRSPAPHQPAPQSLRTAQTPPPQYRPRHGSPGAPLNASASAPTAAIGRPPGAGMRPPRYLDLPARAAGRAGVDAGHREAVHGSDQPTDRPTDCPRAPARRAAQSEEGSRSRAHAPSNRRRARAAAPPRWLMGAQARKFLFPSTYRTALLSRRAPRARLLTGTSPRNAAGPGRCADLAARPLRRRGGGETGHLFSYGTFWNKEESGFMVPPLVSQGVAVVAVGYDIAPKGRMDTMVLQVRRSLAFLVEQYPGIRGIYLCGHSAGAHLAAMVLSTDWMEYGVVLDIKGAALVSGVYDLEPILHTYVNDVLNMSWEVAQRNSPMLYIAPPGPAAAACEVLVAVAQHDSPEFRRQSQEYGQALRAAGWSVSLLDLAGVDHFDIIEKLSEDSYVLTQVILNMISRA
uniref:Arylformamidase n=1 Tax=Falco tinnunculus TaxID=100819 RepID=A0A8C4XIM1_FALTI